MRNSRKHLYEFGAFRIDVEERLLLRDHDIVPLPPKAFDTLLLLVRNPGRALEKNTMMKELWPDVFVEEANLAQHISLLRKTLGEGPTEPKYIETIPRRGYRFLAKVVEVRNERAATLLVKQLASSRYTLVRRALAALVLVATGFVGSVLLFRVRPTETIPYRFTPLVVDPSLKTFPA